MAAWVESGLLVAIVLMLLEARVNLGIRVALIERDLQWVRATLAKWGMIAPAEKSET